MLIFGLFIDPKCLRGIGNRLVTLNAVVAVADDLIVRCVGVALAVIGSVGILHEALTSISAGKTTDYKTLLAYGALLGLSGASFFAAGEIDNRLDVKPERQLSALAAVIDRAAVLASWVQILPGSADCVLSPAPLKVNAEMTGGPEQCAPAFSARAVVGKDTPCPSVMVTFGGGRSEKIQLVERHIHYGLVWKDATVCAGPIPHDKSEPSTLEFLPSGPKIPVDLGPKSTGLAQIIALGDSGCRDTVKGQVLQKCDDPLVWPFAMVAGAAAGSLLSSVPNPATPLIIHLGDYLYQRGKGWSGWHKQFFQPARTLLAAGPWIMVRGNHERCGDPKDPRFTFIDDAPGYNLLFGSDENEWCAKEDEILPTYAVDVSATLRLIVADSSTAFCKSSTPAKCDDDGEVDPRRQLLRSIERLMPNSGKKEVWLATHVPIFAVEQEEAKEQEKGAEQEKAVEQRKPVLNTPKSSLAMVEAWNKSKLENLKKLRVVLSGDRHLLQTGEMGTSETDPPLQLTVGTGGVSLDEFPIVKLDELPIINGTNIDGLVVPRGADPRKLCSFKGFGFLLATAKGGAFELHFVPVDNTSSDKPCTLTYQSAL